MKTAVIAGATGLVGKQLMYKLLESDIYQTVTILVRNTIHVNHPKLNQVVINFDELDKSGGLITGEDFYCCLGTTMKKAGSKEQFYKVDYNYCLNFARLAERQKAENFLIISAIGSDSKSKIYYSKVKGEMESSLIQLDIKRIHIFHPAALIGNRLETRIGETIGIAVSKVLSPLLIGKLAKYKPVEASKLATSMFSKAQSVSENKVNIYTFSNF